MAPSAVVEGRTYRVIEFSKTNFAACIYKEDFVCMKSIKCATF